MLKNFDETLKDMNNADILDNGVIVTMKSIIVNAITSPEYGRELSGVQRLDAHKLSLRIHAGGEQEITPEDAVLIKQACEKQYPSPLVYGRICEFIG